MECGRCSRQPSSSEILRGDLFSCRHGRATSETVRRWMRLEVEHSRWPGLATTPRPHEAGKRRGAARSDEIREPMRGKGKRPESLILRKRHETASDLHTAEVTGSIPVVPT